jgi:hypothetical protein
MASGRVADLIAGFMLVELIALSIVYRRTGHGVPPPELAASLAAGMGLLFALRAALVGSGWQRVALWLIVALVGHVLYVTLRWRPNRLSQHRR